jgi:hypothetical protein
VNSTIEAVHAVFRAAGYESIRSNKKTHGYRSPCGQIIYLSLAQSRSPWRVTIDPRLPKDVARAPGIEVLDAYYHGCNMLEFPREKLGGEREIPYGWRLKVSCAALIPVLRKLDETPIPGS